MPPFSKPSELQKAGCSKRFKFNKSIEKEASFFEERGSFEKVPLSSKLLNRQMREHEPLNVAHALSFVQTLRV